MSGLKMNVACFNAEIYFKNYINVPNYKITQDETWVARYFRTEKSH